MPSSSSVDPGHDVASATDLDASTAAVPWRPRAGPGHHASPEDFASSLRRQHEVDAICKEHGVPKELTAHLAGALRANASLPRGAICVYARALEAGMGVPLHGFLCDALAHFGIAPAQLTPDGWRIVKGFLALCRSEGVPPSLAVFRYFFLLRAVSLRQKKGWYFFRSRDSSGLRFAGMPNPSSASSKDAKGEFFFLSSPEPWPCPVDWGQPSKRSLKIPVLTREENKWAAKLVLAHGGAAVDLRTYLFNSNLAAMLPPPPPRSSFACIISSPQGMAPSVYGMMKTMLAEKVKAGQGSKAAVSRQLCGKKRNLEEANDEECPPSSSMLNSALPSGVCSTPPGFSPKPQHLPSRHGGQRTHRVATREQLEEAKRELASAKRETEQAKAKGELAAARAELAKAEARLATAEAEVVKAQAELTAAKRLADAGQDEARPELAVEGAKAKLAAAKRALEEELEGAKSAALHQLLCCEEQVRLRAERALEGHRHWRTGHAPAGCSAWLAYR